VIHAWKSGLRTVVPNRIGTTTHTVRIRRIPPPVSRARAPIVGTPNDPNDDRLAGQSVVAAAPTIR